MPDPNSTAPTLDPLDGLIDAEFIERDLRISARARRQFVADGRLPAPAGYLGARPRWRLGDYLAARAALLAAGRARRPGESQHGAAHG